MNNTNNFSVKKLYINKYLIVQNFRIILEKKNHLMSQK